MSARHRFGLDEFFQIWLAAAREHKLPHLVAQLNNGLKVDASGQDRIGDLDANWTVARKPLIAAQYRPRALDDAREDWEVCFGGNLERAEIEAGQPGSPGESSFGEEDQ